VVTGLPPGSPRQTVTGGSGRLQTGRSCTGEHPSTSPEPGRFTLGQSRRDSGKTGITIAVSGTGSTMTTETGKEKRSTCARTLSQRYLLGEKRRERGKYNMYEKTEACIVDDHKTNWKGNKDEIWAAVGHRPDPSFPNRVARKIKRGPSESELENEGASRGSPSNVKQAKS